MKITTPDGTIVEGELEEIIAYYREMSKMNDEMLEKRNSEITKAVLSIRKTDNEA